MVQETTIPTSQGTNTSMNNSSHSERINQLPARESTDLDRETALKLFRDMTLGRRFEDKCAEMYYRGKMFGFVHLYNGQEAVSSGVICAMKKQHDWLLFFIYVFV